jgi:hypothetical protein
MTPKPETTRDGENLIEEPEFLRLVMDPKNRREWFRITAEEAAQNGMAWLRCSHKGRMALVEAWKVRPMDMGRPRWWRP